MYSKYRKHKGSQYKTPKTRWNNTEGVFETVQGKWIVIVDNGNKGYYTLCQRDTKELAEYEYNKYLTTHT